MLLKTIAIAASLFLITESALSQTIMSSEPPPGQLGAGQVVYVSCGPGKARKITGGSNMTAGGTLGKGAQRQRGPCVAMKGG